METHDPSLFELVQICIDGNLYYAFKWWDEQDAGGRADRYVVKDPTCGVVSYMLIFCAPRLPCGTSLAAVKFYTVEGPDEHTDLWPAKPHGIMEIRTVKAQSASARQKRRFRPTEGCRATLNR
jgi:hypothetical protein